MALLTDTLAKTSRFLGGDKPYVFHEYPKTVYPEGWLDHLIHKGGVIVHTREEEAQVMGEAFEASPTVAPYIAKVIPPAPVAPPDNGERAFLCNMLDKLGEKYDREQPIVDLRDLLQRLASAPEPVAKVETKTYSDGTQATGVAPLPELSPAQQDAAEAPAEAPAPVVEGEIKAAE